VGFFPFQQGRLGSGEPIAAGLTDCQGVIHAPGVRWDARELLRACRLSVWRFDHLEAEQRSFEPYRTGIRPSPIIDLSGGFDSYYEKLRSQSSQFCKNAERKARKLEREVGELRFVTDSDDISAFRALLTWKSAQYKRTGQIDIFARPWIADLVETLFVTHGTHFSGLFSVLYAADVPIAAHFGLRSGGLLAHWFPAYDVGFSNYSAGLIMHLRMAEHMPSVGVDLIDLGTGVQRYKEQLKNGDFFVGVGTATAGSPRGAVMATALRVREGGGRWMVNAVKRNPVLFGAAGWLRTRYRRIR
jgi:CelD/BcsL family acetyltransferase involved in cellulose biosynthesis